MSAATQFAQWLEKEHPDIYAEMYSRALSQTHRFGGLGDDTSDASNPALQDIAVDAIDSSNVVTTPDVASSDSGGIGTGILSSLESVGSWMVSPQGLTTLANVGTSVLKVQQAQTVAQTQQQVILANAQRAASGQSPIPITYAQSAQTGAVVPVYDTSTVQMMPPTLETAISQGRAHAITLPDGSTGYEIDPPTLTSLLNSTGIPWYGWAVGVALLLALLR